MQQKKCLDTWMTAAIRCPIWSLTCYFSTLLLESPPCWGQHPLVQSHDVLHASQTASQCTVAVGGGVLRAKGDDWPAHSSERRWLPYLIGMRREERRSTRREEKNNEKEKRPQGFLPRPSLNAHTKDHTHTHTHVTQLCGEIRCWDESMNSTWLPLNVFF